MDNSSFKTTLEPVNLDNANELQKPLLENSLKQMGMIPNMYANMVNSPGLMETYAVGYDHFRKNSGLSPVEQEVVFVTISVANNCTYCVAAHSFIADNASKVPADVTNAIRDGKEIPDAKLQALSKFTRLMFDKRGFPTYAEVQEFLEAGFEQKHVLEIILALAVKTLSNYSNHIFHTEVDDLFSHRAWEKN
ncbi:carboxymuconolactone decarboxylase family protein [Pontibacter sp. CAU 1760]